MRFILLIAFIAFANAQEYREALKAGQRHFTSGLKQGSNGVMYDIKLVEGFHSLDQEGDVESILCAEESVLILANEKLNWKAGDVFVGDKRWQCGKGIARVVKEIALKGEKDGKFEYFVKTVDAVLEDIFEYASIHFENPESEAEFDERQKLLLEGKPVKAAVGEYSKTFTMAEKTITLVNNNYLRSVINAKAEIPVYFSGFDADIKVSSLSESSVKASIKASIVFTLDWDNEAKASYSNSFKKDLYNYGSVSFSITAGPVVLSFTVKPSVSVGAEVSFDGRATASMTYRKQLSATVTLNTKTSPKVKLSGKDETSGAVPSFSASANMYGSATPYATAGISLLAEVYAVDVITGTVTVTLKVVGTLQNTKISITPKILLGYSLKLIVWDVAAGEKLLYTGSTKTISFK